MMKRYFHVKGRYGFEVIERVPYTAEIDSVIEADDENDAIDKAIDKAVEEYKDCEVNERFRSTVKAKQTDPPEPPATDITLWMLPRSVAPTLLPAEVIDACTRTSR